MKTKILPFTALLFYLLVQTSCHNNNQNNPDFLKATFNGVTHNYGQISSSSFGVTRGISGIEGVGSAISIVLHSNVSGTYNLCVACGSSLANVINLTYNNNTWSSSENGSVIVTFSNTAMTGSFSGFLYFAGTDSVYVSGSFNHNL